MTICNLHERGKYAIRILWTIDFRSLRLAWFQGVAHGCVSEFVRIWNIGRFDKRARICFWKFAHKWEWCQDQDTWVVSGLEHDETTAVYTDRPTWSTWPSTISWTCFCFLVWWQLLQILRYSHISGSFVGLCKQKVNTCRFSKHIV